MINTLQKNRLKYSFLIIFLIVVSGIVGYMSIEEYNFIDALYMTIITLATVGFKEVHDLSNSGKIFTILLIISSLGTFAYAFSILGSLFFENKLSLLIKGYKNKTDIKKMKDHVIICGFGRNGKQAANELNLYKHNVLVIEKNQEIILTNIKNESNFINGDATDEEVLISAGIHHAKALITTLPSDANNLFVVLTARSLNKDINIISRASDENSDKKLKIAGANNIVMPEKIGGAHMAKLIARTDIIAFLEYISIKNVAPTNLEEIDFQCNDKTKKLYSIADLQIRAKSGANIVGYKTPENEYILNPGPDTVVLPGSKFFVLGTNEQILNMKKILKSR